MRILRIIAIMAVISAVYFYNTTWFQSMFFDDFYKNIAEVRFDIFKNRNKILIPINYKYNTCYELDIAIPGKNLISYRKEGSGILHYKFLSNGSLLTEGVTYMVSRHHMGGNDDYTTLKLMVFNLPIKRQSDDLILELEVIEPFIFISEYEGQTSIIIKPNYETKVGGCYNESLRIIQ